MFFFQHILWCPKNNLNLFGMRTSREWQSVFRASFHHSSLPYRSPLFFFHFLSFFLLHPPSILIDAPQKKRPFLPAGQKKNRKGKKKKKQLGSTFLFIHFPLQIRQAFSLLSFSPTTAMALDTAASLSSLLCVWRWCPLSYRKFKVKSRQTEPIRRAWLVFVTTENIIQMLETKKTALISI